MTGAPPGSRFVLLATDPMARIDVPFLMSQKNGRMIGVEEADGLLRLTVETGESRDAPTD
ncbi:MAG: sulfurtransferase TusA family protein [Brevundimonas sp.]|uniref:sulfurtransferase TusA family protein n=1 Tax=Brevundimonas sp. TaxID=1871086 RepID=UPI00391B7CC0